MKNYFIRYVGEDVTEMVITSKAHGRVKVLVDTEDVEKLDRFKWHVSWTTCSTPARFYIKAMGGRLLLHRYLMKAPNGNRKIVVDHINGNTLDDRKCNLRVTSQSLNSKNRCAVQNSHSWRVRETPCSIKSPL